MLIAYSISKIYKEENIIYTNEKLFLYTTLDVVNYQIINKSHVSPSRLLLGYFANQWLHNNVLLFANLHTREKSFDKSNHGLIVYARKPQVGTDRRKPARKAREERRRG